MKVTSEKTGQGEVTLSIEVDKDRVQKALQQAARELSRRARIPGFRPGKAPYYLVERYLGKEHLYGKAVESLGPDVYREALEQAGIEPYAQGNLDIAQMEPLILKAVVPVTPVVTLGDYKSVRVPKQEVSFDEQGIERTIEQLREQHAEWTPVDRPIQIGDQVTIDLEGRVGEVGVLSQTSRRTEVSAEMFPSGLSEKLIGAKAGDTIDYAVAFPADHSNVQFAGKNVAFHLGILQASEKHLPDLDDSFAKSVGDYESMDQLRKRVHEQLIGQQERAAREKMEDEILEAIAQKTTFEYPVVAIEHELDQRIQDLRQRVQEQGFSWESYLKITGKTEAEIREEGHADAEKALRQSLLLSQVAQAEGMEVSDEEVDAEVQRLSQPYGERAEVLKAALSRPDSKAAVKSRLRLSKAMDRLVAIATGELERSAAPAAEGSSEGADAEKPQSAEQPSTTAS